jgi:hypothetical protein
VEVIVSRIISALVIFAFVFTGAPAVAAGVTVAVDGQPLYLNPGPIERAGRVFVPLRGIFERLGASVVYQNGQINSTKGSTSVSLQIGSQQATVNGQPQTLDVAPFIVGATTYVPLRFVAQSLGAVVDYNGNTRLVAITAAGGGGGGGYAPRPPRPNPPPPMPPPAARVQLRNLQPSPNTTVNERIPTIAANFAPLADGASVRVRLDGRDITWSSGVSPSGFSYRPSEALAFGTHTVQVTGRGRSGAPFEHSWSFTTSTRPLPPPVTPVQLRNQQPSPSGTVDNRFAVISANFAPPAEAASVRVRLDGNDITGRAGVSATGFSYKPPAPLDFGSHTVQVNGRARGGAAFAHSWSFNVRRSGPGPIPLTINQPGANAVVGRTFIVSGSTAPNASVNVTAGASQSAAAGQFNGNTTAGPRGNFQISVTLKALMGQQSVTVRITATDPSSSQTATTTLQLRFRAGATSDSQ